MDPCGVAEAINLAGRRVPAGRVAQGKKLVEERPQEPPSDHDPECTDGVLRGIAQHRLVLRGSNRGMLPGLSGDRHDGSFR